MRALYQLVVLVSYLARQYWQNNFSSPPEAVSIQDHSTQYGAIQIPTDDGDDSAGVEGPQNNPPQDNNDDDIGVALLEPEPEPEQNPVSDILLSVPEAPEIPPIRTDAYWDRFKNIAELVATAVATNGLWQYLNSVGIGNLTTESGWGDLSPGLIPRHQ